jgi:hypothetical protein
VNLNDSTLRYAQLAQGASRAGRPDADELSDAESRWLIEASRSADFDVIDIETAAAPTKTLKAHDYWYNNPRVSTDIIIQMLSHAPPGQRGLEKYLTPKGYKVWLFPEDYRDRAIAAVEMLRMTGEE